MPAPKSNPELLRFQCVNCKAKLRVKMAFAGRYIVCPKCSKRIPVPSSQQEADDDARDYGVKMNAYDVPKNCTKCKAKMPKGAVICVNCGFNYREGRQTEVEDHTVKEGEPMRGGPALRFLIGEVTIALLAIGWLGFRLTGEGPAWWELGGLAGLVVYLLAAAVAHFLQWNDYHELPIREHARLEEEDRAERDEAREPFGRKTAMLWIACVGGGVGMAYLYHWQYGANTAVVVSAPVEKAAKPPPPPPPPEPEEPVRDSRIMGLCSSAALQFLADLQSEDPIVALAQCSEAFKAKATPEAIDAAIASGSKAGYSEKNIASADYGILSMEPPGLPDPDFVYDKTKDPNERAANVISEIGADSADIPVDKRLGWVFFDVAFKPDAMGAVAPPVRIVMLIEKVDDTGKVGYVQFRKRP